MRLDLPDDEIAVLIRKLTDITFTARYPLSPRVQTWKAILGKIHPEPAPPTKVYEPPSKGRYRRRDR